MRKIIVFSAIGLALFGAGYIYAETAANNQTAREEAQGKAIYDQLQSNQINCSKLTDDEFDFLGDYYMGQMMGSSHLAMDNLMTQRMGEANNRLMHIALGKRLSNCDPAAPFPSQGTNFLPMMGIMGNYGGYGMMGWGGWPSYYGTNYWMWAVPVLFVILIILAIVWLVFDIIYKKNKMK